jgi:hypothetical protein
VSRTSLHHRFAGVALTLTALLGACGGEDSAGPGGGTGGDLGEGTGAAIPAELVGQWSYGSISPTNFWNEHTGQYAGNAYGVGAWFTFRSRGAYEQFIYQYTQNYGCQTQVWTRIRGNMEVQDDVLTFNPTSGEYKVADNCVASHNYRRDMTGQEISDKQGEEWQWYFAVNPLDNKTYLMMGWVGSEAFYFKPAE